MTENTLDSITTLGVTKKTAQDVGNRLRTTREATGQSTAIIAARIRVREHYLVAMESGDWEILPPGVNGRGLIRIYARDLCIELPEISGQTPNAESMSLERPITRKVETPLEIRSYKPNTNGHNSESFNKNSASKKIGTSNFAQKGTSPKFNKQYNNHISSARNATNSNNTHADIEDDDTKTIAVNNPELERLLGIDSNTYAQNNDNVKLYKAEIKLDGNIPIVNAEDMAKEMFVENTQQTEATIIPPKKELEIKESINQPLSNKNIETEETASTVKIIVQEQKENIINKIPDIEFTATKQINTSINIPNNSEAPIKAKTSEIKIIKNPEDSNKNELFQQSNKAQTEKSRPLQTNYTTRYILIFAGILFIIIVSMIIIKINHSDKRAETIRKSVAIPVDPINKNDDVALEIPTTSASTLITPTVQGTITTPLAQIATPQATPTLEPTIIPIKSATLTITEAVQMTIKIDGKGFYTGTHEPGELILNFKNNADVYVEDGSKVELSFGEWNDHGPLGWSGRKRRIIINSHSSPSIINGQL